MPPADWQRIIGVNLTGTFFVCQAAIPFLLDGGGSIVNVASNAGLMAQPYSAAPPRRAAWSRSRAPSPTSTSSAASA
jgi:NAD(P)-dependent dehydrogenase (short-subunit alcohol dehydrogenase family)